jgi:hypothetical protein
VCCLLVLNLVSSTLPCIRVRTYIYCQPPAGGRIRSQGNYCLPPAGGRIRFPRLNEEGGFMAVGPFLFLKEQIKKPSHTYWAGEKRSTRARSAP